MRGPYLQSPLWPEKKKLPGRGSVPQRRYDRRSGGEGTRSGSAGRAARVEMAGHRGRRLGEDLRGSVGTSPGWGSRAGRHSHRRRRGHARRQSRAARHRASAAQAPLLRGCAPPQPALAGRRRGGMPEMGMGGRRGEKAGGEELGEGDRERSSERAVGRG